MQQNAALVLDSDSFNFIESDFPSRAIVEFCRPSPCSCCGVDSEEFDEASSLQGADSDRRRERWAATASGGRFRFGF